MQPALGEVLSPIQQWDNGAPPIQLPRAITVGHNDCIQNGESIAEGLRLNDPARFRSWPEECFRPDPIDDYGWAAAVFRCPVQAWWADRIIELSEGRIGILTAALRQRFPGASVKFWDGEDLFPPMMTIRHPQYAIAQIAETQNAKQALIQVLEGVRPPTNVGGFGSTNIWNSQALRALIRLSDEGCLNFEPLLFVGYSYGGAAALCASAITRLSNRDRTIRFLTFGAPRPGDQRMKELLDLPTRGCCLANNNDGITAIPPDLDTIIPAESILGRNLIPFTRWRPPNETWRQNPDGSIEENAYPSLSTREILDLLELVWTTGTLFGYPAHNIREYRRRIRLRCPTAPDIAEGAIGFLNRRLGGVGLAAAGRMSRGDAIGLRGYGSKLSGALGLGPELPTIGPLVLHGPKVAVGRLGIGRPLMAERGKLAFWKMPYARGKIGLAETLLRGRVGFSAFGRAFQLLGFGGASNQARGQLALRALEPVKAAGDVGLLFKGIPGQLGLAAQIAAAAGVGLVFRPPVQSVVFDAARLAIGDVGLLFKGIPGQLGLCWRGIPGQLGLGVAVPAAGQLGLGVAVPAAGQLGLGVAASSAAGQLGLAFKGIPGQLGLQTGIPLVLGLAKLGLQGFSPALGSLVLFGPGGTSVSQGWVAFLLNQPGPQLWLYSYGPGFTGPLLSTHTFLTLTAGNPYTLTIADSAGTVTASCVDNSGLQTAALTDSTGAALKGVGWGWLTYVGGSVVMNTVVSGITGGLLSTWNMFKGKINGITSGPISPSGSNIGQVDSVAFAGGEYPAMAVQVNATAGNTISIDFIYDPTDGGGGPCAWTRLG